ncbi:MAG: glycosyltransferase [Chloroflexota bacterium]|nr:glycosyltransferase [Chloroflexota bacterium]MDQ5866414.1 glycosyltransferase [Chloroflexota bacterium]
MSRLDRLSGVLLAAFVLDRALKLAAVVHFFRRKSPSPPPTWPAVTLLQPLSRGASDLRAALVSRAPLDYPAPVQHLFVCDEADEASQTACRNLMRDFPTLQGQVVVVPRGASPMSFKTVKLQVGMEHAKGEVVCCVDDDILLRPDALRLLVPYLHEPGAGAVFGLACYTSWRNLPTSLMSAFVNSNALLSYVPLTYMADPFTITGHCYALRREVLESVDEFRGMEHHFGDDHELAWRLRDKGLRSVQTPLVYDVVNHFDTLGQYAAQMKRWFVFPRQMLLPAMTQRERAVSFLGSAGNLLPGLLLLLALVTRRAAITRALGMSLGLSGAIYYICEKLYLKRRTPLKWWPLVLVTALFAPFQVVWALLSDDVIEWRGRKVRVLKGGRYAEVES